MVDEVGTRAPIDPARVCRVVSNDYLRKGGDGYRMFAEAADAHDYGPDLADVTGAWMAVNGPVSPVPDGRITRR